MKLLKITLNLTKNWKIQIRENAGFAIKKNQERNEGIEAADSNKQKRKWNYWNKIPRLSCD